MAIQNGMVLNNRYKIIKLLGSGGTAQVYQAEDLNNGRHVAIKVLKPEFNDDEEFVRRFDAEARAASSLAHENIVKVLGMGVDHGLRYMVQEYVDGVTLKAMILHYHRLDWRIAVPIFIQIAMALESAHMGGVIHRDIKSQNIMIDRKHRALVTDFGIARAISQGQITRAGGPAVGSVHYISPEHARGGMIGEKADLYSLGILMYETLTGKLPFTGDTEMSIIIKQFQEKPVPPMDLEPTIPKGLSDIVLKCMQKDPGDRYANARALINDLDSFIINPQGVYGLGRDDQQRRQAQKIKMQQDQLKTRIYDYKTERDVRKRRRWKENGVIIVIILLGLCLVFAGGVYLYRYLNTQIEEAANRGFVMPNLKGMTLEEAVKILDENNVQHTQREEYNDTIAKGLIISQSIAPSERVTSNMMTQELIVSKGSGFVNIVSYTGKNPDEVIRELQTMGLNVTKLNEISDTVPEGQVIDTSPTAGSRLKLGDTITIYISSGIKDVRITDFQLFGSLTSQALEILKKNDIVVKNITIPEGLGDSNSFIWSITDMAGNELLWNKEIILHSGDEVNIVAQSYSTFHPEESPTPSPTAGEGQ